MTKRICFSSGSAFEPLRGYSRAVQVGDALSISGTVALDASGEVVGIGSPYNQTRYIFDQFRDVLREAGMSLANIVRTRIYVTDLRAWDEVARAHREVFENTRPASSIVEVARLIDPRLLVEIEAEAHAAATGSPEIHRLGES